MDRENKIVVSEEIENRLIFEEIEKTVSKEIEKSISKEIDNKITRDVIISKENDKKIVCIVGVGFVGKHLIDVFRRNSEFEIIGYDTSRDRVDELVNQNNYNNVRYQSTTCDLEKCDIFLIAVPTDIDFETKQPKLKNLLQVRLMLETFAKRDSIVVIESSVYIGGTRELFGNLKNNGIYVGFSPERVDP